MRETEMNSIDDFKKLLTIKRYSNRTIRSYSHALKSCSSHFEHKNPENINPSDIVQFINKMVRDYNISQSYQKVLVGAIKLFYNELLRKNYKINYLYPDRPEKNYQLC